MTSEQKKQAIVGVLLAVALGILVYQFVLKPAGSDSSSSSAAPPAAQGERLELNKVREELEAITNVDPLLSEIRVVNFVYENEKMDRNPMEPVQRKIESGDPNAQQTVVTDVMRRIFDMKVTGILWNEQRPMAIVDNELVAVGHTYPDGVRIVQIDRDRVWFDVEDARIPLELKEL